MMIDCKCSGNVACSGCKAAAAQEPRAERQAPPAPETHRPCTRCKGEGTIPDILNKSKMRDCLSCGGTGEFAPINLDDLLNRIRASQGKNKGRLRASMTSPIRKDGMNAARAYYVWRMARFHGGQDTTMPITASYCVHGDPFTDKLDAIADHIAKQAFGTDLAGVARWARAFGMV